MMQRWLSALYEAREEIAKPGQWCKGSLSSHPDGARCALGWLLWCAKSIDINAANELLQQHLPKPFCTEFGVSYYNDQPETTLDDIVTVFDKAIIRLEAKPTLDTGK